MWLWMIYASEVRKMLSCLAAAYKKPVFGVVVTAAWLELAANDLRVLCGGYNCDLTAVDGRSTTYQTSLRSQWRNTAADPLAAV